MPESERNIGVRCIQAFFVLVLIGLVVVGVVIYLDSSIPSFIGIILIVTAGLVVLAVIFLALNAYCNRKYSRSFEIRGLTDGLEFDEVQERWYGNSSRKPSLQHRHSMYDQDVAIVLDSIPHDVSDDDDDEDGNTVNEMSNLNNDIESNYNPPPNVNAANSNDWRHRNETIPEEVEEEEIEEDRSNSHELNAEPPLDSLHDNENSDNDNSDNDVNNNNSEDDNMNNDNNNNENNQEQLELPSYEDAISNYDEGKTLNVCLIRKINKSSY